MICYIISTFDKNIIDFQINLYYNLFFAKIIWYNRAIDGIIVVERGIFMNYKYKTHGTCSSQIEFDVEDGIVRNVRFTGGCNGNLKAIAALVEGQPKDKVISILKGIKCGYKDTSCGDQLARALEEVK